MKRLLAAISLAALCLLPSLAQAVNVTAPFLKTEQLSFRVHKATAAAGENLRDDYVGTTSCTACMVDSGITNRIGVQNMVLDTTTSISTSLWARPSQVAISAVDTNMVYCALNVFDNAATSSTTADSIYVSAQASYDGKVWFTLATLIGGTAASITSKLDQTNGTGTFFGLLNKLGASGGSPSWIKSYKLFTPTSAANDYCGLWRYPLLRFIVGFPDAYNYSVRAQVIYSSVESAN